MTTDQEHIEWLESRMRSQRDLSTDPNTPEYMKRFHVMQADRYAAAAERIRVLGEECEATRAALDDDGTVHVSGKVIDRLYAARAATDAARGGRPCNCTPCDCPCHTTKAMHIQPCCRACPVCGKKNRRIL